ncbi:dihydrofolate reductase family protein [Streptomyces sp. NPDC026673]|uniref:dihydrofolate reductase family protein n=1 Tax=Streptomyces sp. NPDC026673 TaxID=3155724 RepID=UPI0033E19D8A
MRKLTYFVASTIDGFVAGPGGEYDFLAAEGDHMETVVAEYPETLPVHARGPLGIADAPNRRFDTVLMGRATYEVGLPYGMTSPYPHLRQYVVSGSMTASPDPAVELVSDDPLGFVRQLKRRDGAGIWLCGGGRLAASLRPEIDELVVKLNPVVAGAGVPLFAGGFAPQAYDVAEARTYKSGVLMVRYARREG